MNKKILNTALFLSPSVLGALLSLILLPVYTKVLNAYDYGEFALFVSIANFLTQISSLGMGLTLRARFSTLCKTKKKEYISTLFFIVSIVSVIVLVIAYCLITFFSEYITLPSSNTLEYFPLLFGCVFFAPVWMISQIIIDFETKSVSFCALVTTSICVQHAVISYLLFWGEGQKFALHEGFFFSQLVLFFGSFYVLREYLGLYFSKEVVSDLKFLSALSTLSEAVDSFQLVAERYLVSRFVGSTALGLYNHAQQLYKIPLMLLNATDKSFYGSVVKEIKKKKRYLDTSLCVELNLIIIFTSGAVLILFGEDIIGFLTNNKFNDASQYLLGWFLYLVIQNAGKLHQVSCYVFREEKFLIFNKVITKLVMILLSYICIKEFGVQGAIFLMITSLLISKIMIYQKAKEKFKLPFQDSSSVIVFFLFILIDFTRPYFSSVYIIIFLYLPFIIYSLKKIKMIVASLGNEKYHTKLSII